MRRSAAAIVVGSTLSSTVSRGKNSRPSSSHSFQAGRRSAVSSASRPERRPADAEDDDVVVRLAEALREGGDLPDRLGLIDEPVESVFPRGPAAADLRLHRAEPGGELREPRARQSVHAVEPILEHASVGQLDHATSTVRPSYAGRMPSGNCPASSACPVSCVRWVR